MQVQTMTLREALDQLSALTGKEWLRRDLESSGSGNVDIPYSGGMHVMIIDTRGLPSEYTTDWIFSVRAANGDEEYRFNVVRRAHRKGVA